MNLKNKKIRIVFLGDKGVGKTSLITTLISDSFPEQVDAVIAPVILPPEMYVQTHDVSTILIDSSSEIKNEVQINESIKEADVLLLLYDISKKETVDGLKQRWMPKINKINSQVPVIVIATKLDLVKESEEVFRMHEVIKPLMKDYKQVEIGLECSALLGKCLHDVIYCAQKVVLFPLSPLYDARQRVLKDEFKRALKRIFRLCDRDGDRLLSDEELRKFQIEAFHGELTNKDIQGIKDVIREEVEDGVTEQGITFEGFVGLQKKCIDMMKIQTCWTILRHYGYNEKLEINEDQFADELILDERKSQSVELTGTSIGFLRRLFRQHSKAQLINYSGIIEIFDPINTLPWTNIERLVKTEIYDDEICISEQSWICLWHLLTNNDYKRCFKFLKYIGFRGYLADAFKTTNKKDNLSDLLRTSERDVFHIYVIGHGGSGKTQLLDYFISQRFSELHVPSPSTKSVITPITFPNHKTKYFIFTEIPMIEVESMLDSEERMPKCDILLILFDDENKAKLFTNDVGRVIPDYVPRIVVQTKYENGNPLQSLQSLSESVKLSDSEFFTVPRISIKEKNLDELIDILYTVIEKPTKSIPISMIEILKEQKSFWEKGWGILGIGLLSLTGVFLILQYRHKIYKKYFSNK